MEATRAKEIMNSTKKIEVLYNDTPVWIENVDENRQIAYVKDLSTNQIMEVDSSKLNETNNNMKM